MARVLIEPVTPHVAMNIINGRLRPVLFYIGVVLSTGSISVSQATDGQPRFADSPFETGLAVSAPVRAGVEFRGIVREGDVWLVNLYAAATKKSYWLPVGGGAAGLLVKSYDEATGRLTVLQGDEPLLLSLKQSRVLLQGNNTPLKLLGPADRITEAEAPHMPEFLRDLPPEARKLLEEARRRRAIRWPAMVPDAAAPVARP